MPRLNICRTCFNKLTPVTVDSNLTVSFTGVKDTCDICGQVNTDGIYVRKDADPIKPQLPVPPHQC